MIFWWEERKLYSFIFQNDQFLKCGLWVSAIWISDRVWLLLDISLGRLHREKKYWFQLLIPVLVEMLPHPPWPITYCYNVPPSGGLALFSILGKSATLFATYMWLTTQLSKREASKSQAHHKASPHLCLFSIACTHQSWFEKILKHVNSLPTVLSANLKPSLRCRRSISYWIWHCGSEYFKLSQSVVVEANRLSHITYISRTQSYILK